MSSRSRRSLTCATEQRSHVDSLHVGPLARRSHLPPEGIRLLLVIAATRWEIIHGGPSAEAAEVLWVLLDTGRACVSSGRHFALSPSRRERRSPVRRKSRRIGLLLLAAVAAALGLVLEIAYAATPDHVSAEHGASGYRPGSTIASTAIGRGQSRLTTCPTTRTRAGLRPGAGVPRLRLSTRTRSVVRTAGGACTRAAPLPAGVLCADVKHGRVDEFWVA
jgi:hypothetical protein